MFPRRSASERVSEAVIPCCRRRSINPMIGVTENAMEQDRSDDDIVPAVLHIAARAIERAR
jgi:hypothetical protein